MKKFILLIIATLSISLAFGQTTTGEWVSISSDASGDFRDVFFIGDIGWAVGDQYGKVFKTTDKGETWADVRTDTDYLDIDAVWFTSITTGFIVQNYGGYLTAPPNGKIKKTTDGGATWSLVFSITDYEFEDIAFADENNGWAITYSHIYKTVDGGINWVDQNFDSGGGVYDKISIVDANNVHISTGPRLDTATIIAKTTNGGADWVDVIVSGTTNEFLDIHFESNTLAWASSWAGKIYKTVDGVNWTATETGYSVGLNYLDFISDLQGITVSASGLILRTEDGGTTWNEDEITNDGLNAIFYIDDNTAVAVGSSGTILRYTAGNNTGGSVSAAFSATPLEGILPLEVTFTDASTGTPTSWAWTFEGGTPSSSTDQNPTDIVFNTAGTYDVTLVATNADGSDTETKTDYITVTGTSGGGAIVSTTAGGLWNETTTWVGGVVPTATDDVIIDGTVIVNYGKECKNLTVNSGKILTTNVNVSTIKANGNVINNGTIQSNNDENFYLETKGNITNNGVWEDLQIRMVGTTDQTISGSQPYSCKDFSMGIGYDGTGQKLIAGSDLSFISTSFYFNNSEFMIEEGKTVSFSNVLETDWKGMRKCHFIGGGTISSDSLFHFTDSTSFKNVTLTGIIQSYGLIIIKENVELLGVIQPYYGNSKVEFAEDFVNDGTIRDNNDGTHLDATVLKNITNNGIWTNYETRMVGTTDQTISGSQPYSSGQFGMGIGYAGGIGYEATGQKLIAGSDLSFINTSFYFNNHEFMIEEGKTVSFSNVLETDNGRMGKCHFIGGGTIQSDSLFEFSDSTSFKNVTLTGIIQTGDLIIIKENVKLLGVIQSYGNTDRVEFAEDFVNDGTIRDNEWRSLDVTVLKNVTNDSYWENYQIEMNGTSDQTFTNNSHLYSQFKINANVSSATTFQWYKDGVAIDGATGEVYYYYKQASFDEYNPYGAYYCETDAGNSRTISIIGGGSGEGGAIVSTTTGGLWTETTTWIGGVVPTADDDVVIDGTVEVDGGRECKNLTVNSGKILTSYDNTAYIKVWGNLINKGLIEDNEWRAFDLYVKGDITNDGALINYSIRADGTADQIFTNNDSLYIQFDLYANVSSATTFQWYKDGVAIDDVYATGEVWYYVKQSVSFEDYNPYGVYYCETDAGNSRNITITDNSNSNGDAILEENFDGTVFPPTGWAQTILNTSTTWMQENPNENSFTTIDATNVYSALCGYIAEDQDEWLKSPLFSLPDGIFTLDFYAGHSTSWLSAATLKLNISVNGGTNWAQIWEADNDGNGWQWRKITLDLSSYANNSNVMLGWQYVGNDGDLAGIDNVKITQGTTGIFESGVEKDYIQVQNYPNPFSSQTTISFVLENPKHVNLIIYNSLGQKIVEPFNSELNTGKHQFTFDAKGLKSGIYYYRFIVDGVSTTKPMIMTK